MEFKKVVMKIKKGSHRTFQAEGGTLIFCVRGRTREDHYDFHFWIFAKTLPVSFGHGGNDRAGVLFPKFFPDVIGDGMGEPR